jgi:undecaprenyl-diphosphatase
VIKTLFLGIIQGLTEFLPVSSSGHLVIAQHFMKIGGDVVFLDILLHIGTIGAVIVFFFKDILAWVRDLRKILLVFLVTVITGVVGILFKSFFESVFASVRLVCVLLIVNGLILLATKFLREKNRTPDVKDGLWMGLVQGIAVLPGISRSGSTISALFARGIKREEAFRFSFIASIPAVLGAFLYKLKEAGAFPRENASNLAAGAIASFVVGLIALRILDRLIKNHRFYVFGYYCVAVGTLSLGASLYWKPA